MLCCSQWLLLFWFIRIFLSLSRSLCLVLSPFVPCFVVVDFSACFGYSGLLFACLCLDSLSRSCSLLRSFHFFLFFLNRSNFRACIHGCCCRRMLYLSLSLFVCWLLAEPFSILYSYSARSLFVCVCILFITSFIRFAHSFYCDAMQLITQWLLCFMLFPVLSLNLICVRYFRIDSKGINHFVRSHIPSNIRFLLALISPHRLPVCVFFLSHCSIFFSAMQTHTKEENLP